MALKKPSDYFKKQSLSLDNSIQELETTPELNTFSDAFESFKNNLSKIEILSKFSETLNDYQVNVERVNFLSEKVESIGTEIQNLLKKEDLDRAMMSQLLVVEKSILDVQTKVKGINEKNLTEIRLDIVGLTKSVSEFIENDVPKYKKLVIDSELRNTKRYEELEENVSETLEEIQELVEDKYEKLQQNLQGINEEKLIEIITDFKVLDQKILELKEQEIPKYKNLIVETERKTESKLTEFDEKLEDTLINFEQSVQESINGISKKVDQKVDNLQDSIEEVTTNLTNFNEQEIPKYKKLIVETELKTESKLNDFDEKLNQTLTEVLQKISLVEGDKDDLVKIVSDKIQEIQNIKDNIVENLNVGEDYKTKISKKVSDLEIEIIKNESHIKVQNQNLEQIQENVRSAIQKLNFEEIEEQNYELGKKIKYLEEIFDKFNEKEILTENIVTEPSSIDNKDPLTPLDKNFVTLEQLQQHYRLFINRIQQQLATLGGGGETRLEFLDDVDRDSVKQDGYIIQYSSSSGKFVGTPYVPGGGGTSQWVTTSAGIHTLSNVGIGTTNPTSKLTVSGDVFVSGIVTATSFSGNATSATYATSSGISTYSTSSGIATYAISSGISTYSTSSGIATYATSSGISTYATSSGISTYSISSGIATYATSSGISTYSISSGIATYATSSGISTYATSSGISTYSISSGISTYATSSGISTYSTSSGIATYATSSGISTYSTSSGIATYATSSGISTYSTSSGIATYANSSGISTSVIGGIASVTQLNVSGVSTLGILTVGNIFSTGIITATSFIRTNGTSSQFLKADGSVDSNAYLTSYTETDTLNSVTGRGNSTSNGISVGVLTASRGNFSGIVTSSGLSISGVSTLGVVTSGNIFSTGIITATTFSGNLANTLTLNTSGTGLSGSTSFNNSGAATFTVTSNATSANTGSTIVARDGSGNFSAGIITATTFSGNATSATYATSSGVSTSVIGGIASVTQLNVSGVSTVGFITATNAFVSGIVTTGTHNLTTGNTYQINGTSVLSNNTLGSGVVNSSLTSIGTLGSLNVTGTTTLGFVTATNAFVSGITTSGGFNATTGNTYQINGTSVLSNNTLGSGVVNSSLTSVGTLGQLNVTGVSTSGGVNVTTGNTYQINGTSVLSNNTLGSGVVNSSLTSVGTLGQLNVTGTTTLGFVTATNAFVSGVTTSGGVNLTTGNTYQINGTNVLSNNTLGSGVVNSSLTSVGTLGQLSVTGVSTLGVVTSGNIFSTGIITATSFRGDGSQLTGIVASGSGIIIRDDGVLVGTAQSIDFGSNLSVSPVSAGVVTVTASGGGGTSQWVTTSAGIHTLSNVGIGTTNPTSRLTVSGDVFVSGVVTATTFSGNATSATYATSSGISTSVIGGIASVTQLNVSGVSTLGFVTATNAFVSGITTSGGVNVTTGNTYQINGTSVLSNNTLGSGVVNSSLTSVGTLGQLSVTGVSTLGVVTSGNIFSTGIITATSFIRTSGTSSQFLKADGSVDSNVYLTSYTETDTLNSVTGRGNSTSNGISVGILTATGGNFSGIVTSSGLSISGVSTSNGFNATTGNTYQINGTSVLSNNTLGSGVVNSSLTSVGTLGQLNVTGVSTLGIVTTGNIYSTGIVTAVIGFNAITGGDYEINNVPVLTSNTLGSGVVNSSLTSVGTLGQLSVTGVSTLGVVTSGNIFSTGIITATSFRGDGSQLTGIVASGSGIIIRDDGVLVGTAQSIDFGSNLSVSPVSAGVVTVTASGGGGTSQWVTTSAGIHTLSNVGIGTTNPQIKLDLNGDLRILGALYDSSSQVGVGGSVLVSTVTGVKWDSPPIINRTVGVSIDGGGTVITTGTKGYVEVPYAGTITEWKIIADVSGSAVFDVWKSNAAIPTNANTITASAKPTLTAAQRATGTTLTGWTTGVAVNDVFGFEVESASTITKATLILVIRQA